MEYLTSKEAGQKWGVTSRMVNMHCYEGRIEGAVKKGPIWLIPLSAPKPPDGRKTKILVKENEMRP